MKYIGLTSAVLLLAPLLIDVVGATSKAEEGMEEVARQEMCPHVVWLGQQTNSEKSSVLIGKPDFRSTVVHPSGTDQVRWEEQPGKIELQVIQGSKIVLPDTPNGYTTLVNGEVSTIYTMTETRHEGYAEPKLPAEMQIPRHPNGSKLPVEPQNYYVLGVSHLQDSSGAYYTLNVRITEGPLAGAIVHLRDHEHPVSCIDPFVAIYKIPDGLVVPEGELQYEVVFLQRK